MKNFKYLETFEAFTPPLPPNDDIEHVIQYQKQDTSKSDTIKLWDVLPPTKGATENTLDSLDSLGLVEGKLYNCLFDDDITGEIFVSKGNRHPLDFRDLKQDLRKYVQLNNLQNRFKIRIFNSNILKDKVFQNLPQGIKVKEGTIFVSFEPESDGCIVIFIDSQGKPQITNIPENLDTSGE